jgi:hypothetical protein
MNEAHCSRTSLMSSASAQADAGGGGWGAAMMASKMQGVFQVAGVCNRTHSSGGVTSVAAAESSNRFGP